MQNSNEHRNRLLTKNVMFNFIGLGLPMLVAIFSIPLLIAKLGAERFGILTLMWVLISYASLFDLGLGRALTQQLSARLASSSKERSAELVWTSMLGLSGLGILGGIVIFILSPWLVQHPLHVPAAFSIDTIHAFYIMSFSLPFIIATDSVRGVLESHQEFFIVNAVRLPMGIYTFLGPLLALQFANSLTVIAIFLAIGKIINFLLYFRSCFKVMPALKERIKYNYSDLGPLFSLGGWTTVSNIISPLIGYLDRFFIAGISLVAVTYYVTPNEMITKFWLIPGALNAVFFPEFAACFVSNKQNIKLLMEKALKYNFLLLFPIILTAVFFSFQIIHLWLGLSFAQNSFRVLQWLAVGVLVNCLAQVPFSIIQAAGSAHLTAKIHLIELPLYFLVLLFAVKTGSIVVVAFIWFLRMLLDAILMFFAAKMFVPFTIQSRLFLVTPCLLALFAVGFYLNFGLAKILIYSLSLIVFYYFIWLYALTDKEKLPLKRILSLNRYAKLLGYYD